MENYGCRRHENTWANEPQAQSRRSSPTENGGMQLTISALRLPVMGYGLPVRAAPRAREAAIARMCIPRRSIVALHSGLYYRKCSQIIAIVLAKHKCQRRMRTRATYSLGCK